MILGENNLKKMFPEFKEDIGANGIDLRIGEVFIIKEGISFCGCVDDIKLKPDYERVYPVDAKLKGTDNELDKCYAFVPHTFYFIKIDRPIHIPKGYVQRYLLRSSFTRCGLILTDAVGDSDFNGTLMLGVYNSSDDTVVAGVNERIIQAVTETADESTGSYDGSYQFDNFYKEEVDGK